MGKIYKGDIGTEIILDCSSDITTATALAIAAQKPDGSTVSWSAEAKPGTTQIRHITVAGDLDQAGIYLLQAVVTLPDWSGRGETARERIYEPFA